MKPSPGFPGLTPTPRSLARNAPGSTRSPASAHKRRVKLTASGTASHKKNPAGGRLNPGRSPSIWAVPDWLWRTRGLSYHGRADRWLPDGRLRSVGRGQEFVVDVTTQPAAQDWASAMVEEMQR